MRYLHTFSRGRVSSSFGNIIVNHISYGDGCSCPSVVGLIVLASLGRHWFEWGEPGHFPSQNAPLLTTLTHA